MVLLISLSSEYELVAHIVENAKAITRIKVKEKLLKKYERLQIWFKLVVPTLPRKRRT